ncbi:MAG: YicC family protein [Bacteroidetes bacterium 4572_77]|nr:MAG: YicC family protein [Bacteroidetes bacterium 4572_77]
MIKSMTGFARSEATEKGITASVELKSLNGRFLEINCRMPRTISHKERDIRDAIRQGMERGSVQINVKMEFDEVAKPTTINGAAATRCFNALQELRSKLKIKESVSLDHVLQFSDKFMEEEENDNEALQTKVILRALSDAIKTIEIMKTKEGQQIAQDIKKRIGYIEIDMDAVEKISIKRVPDERERLRERIAMLFESDEIDETRLQTEIVLLSDKLDVSEEITRMRSHLKFFIETMKAKESSGKKMNFLLQEMNREVNTLGTKLSDANASKIVVSLKEELEKIREQVQNIV